MLLVESLLRVSCFMLVRILVSTKLSPSKDEQCVCTSTVVCFVYIVSEGADSGCTIFVHNEFDAIWSFFRGVSNGVYDIRRISVPDLLLPVFDRTRTFFGYAPTSKGSSYSTYEMSMLLTHHVLPPPPPHPTPHPRPSTLLPTHPFSH